MDEQNAAGSPELYSGKNTPKKKSSFSKLLIFAIICFIIWWFNNYTLKINEQNITSTKVKNDIRIAVLSDYHAYGGMFAIDSETVLKKIKRINPDIVCALGDMHSLDATDDEKKMSLDVMTDIVNEGYRLFFVLGEHDDRSKSYINTMINKGITVLYDKSQTITVRNTNITLYGISNAYFSPNFDLNNQFDKNKKTYNILLAHIPMYQYYQSFGADLTLCGDTHGGIIQIPFLGPVYHDGQFFPEFNNDKSTIYDKGLFEYEGGYMFITSGIGNYIMNKNLPVRFFNRPEIASITISPE